MKQHRYIVIAILLILFPFSLWAQMITIFGKVQDNNGRPLQYASVKLIDYDRTVYSNTDGNYTISIARKNIENLRIVFSMVGKTTVDSTLIISTANNYTLNVVLKDLSLSLKEVQVSAEQKTTSSNSSIVFNSQTIEQSQAFSLADILNLLPGRQYSPVDLQSPKMITLRTQGDSDVALNNAMGTAIIVDGLAQNNNANMQTKNIGTYPSSTINDRHNTNQNYDVTFGGLDLREIPVDNIEKIEVISGVAPAKYGDLTDGAIIIDRKAGKTSYSFNTRINNGSTNFSLNKGYQLPQKAGFLNANFNYLISNNDPRDNMKKYSRVSGGLMHTIYFSNKIKNTFSVDYSAKLDDIKQDPDDGREEMIYSINRKLTVSNRLSWQLNNKIIKDIQLSTGLSVGFQDTYSQYYINGNVKPMANKDTMGVYEGYYLQGNYLAVDQVQGKPRNFNGNLNFSSDFNTGNIKHVISYGVSLSLSNNGGKGVLFDPDRPRLVSLLGYKNERPYNFQLIPNVINSGFYAEDRFNIKVFGKNLRFNTGIRYDMQNGYGAIQPRLSSNLNISKHLSLNAAYGMATKAPTMAYRYPGPTYFDIPLLNVYTGNASNSLFLVYTHKYIPDNSLLKPSKSNQAEVGLNYQHKLFSASIHGYYKNNTDGFNAQSSIFFLQVPEYTYTINNNQKPVYTPTGNYKIVADIRNNVVTNNVTSKNSGLELFVTVRKIKAIQTSFTLNTAYGYSSYYNAGDLIASANINDILADKKAWYAVYEAAESIGKSLSSSLTSDTHFSSLGLVASLYLDMVWLKNQHYLGQDRYPKGYIDKYGGYYPITNFDPNNPDYGYLLKKIEKSTQKKLPFAYGNISMRVAKELKNNISFSVNAYNVFNLNPKYYDRTLTTPSTLKYLSPLSVGAAISIKF